MGVVRRLLQQPCCCYALWVLLRIAVVVSVVLRDRLGIGVCEPIVDLDPNFVVLGLRVTVIVGVW